MKKVTLAVFDEPKPLMGHSWAEFLVTVIYTVFNVLGKILSLSVDTNQSLYDLHDVIKCNHFNLYNKRNNYE